MLGCKAFKIFVKDKKSNSCPFQAKYKDPRTGIQYNNSMEFGSIRSLPMDIVSGYLTLRKAAPTWIKLIVYGILDVNLIM